METPKESPIELPKFSMNKKTFYGPTTKAELDVTIYRTRNSVLSTMSKFPTVSMYGQRR